MVASAKSLGAPEVSLEACYPAPARGRRKAGCDDSLGRLRRRARRGRNRQRATASRRPGPTIRRLSLLSPYLDVVFPPVMSVPSCNCRSMHEDFDRCYRAVQSKDARFDGWFVTAVLSTHIYCRPSCPVRPPFARNVRFYPTAAAAQRAGFRACKRCRPDVSPGSPEWNIRCDVVARAMRLIADGTVDRDGVTGLAAHLGYTTRQLERLLQAEVGANPLALARAQRTQTARVLIETTDLPFGDVAFAAGFASIRQFNDTVRAFFDLSPTDLRRRAATRREPQAAAASTLTLRLPVRQPCGYEGVFGHLASTAVPGG